MKLIIQIPCFNEESTLKQTIDELPKKIPGIDQVEILVIDDGCTDHTSDVASECGVDHILKLGTNRGLARAFSSGVQYALENGADIVVNTDADNQYKGDDIRKLVAPIVNYEADMVVGCRPIVDHPEFSNTKKILQLLGSWTLRKVSKTEVRDATSGFRAFTRDTCQRMFVHSSFSYTMETLIQAGVNGARVHSVDIGVNEKTRESRLFKSVPEFVFKTGLTILTMFIYYRPGAFFSVVGSLFMSLALMIGGRFLYLVYVAEPVIGRTYLPSLILLAIFVLIGLFFYSLGIVGVILKSQRRVTEESVFLLRKSVEK